MRLIFEDLTVEQAEELAKWYCESGEQSAYDWFDIRGIHDASPVYTSKRKEGNDLIITTV